MKKTITATPMQRAMTFIWFGACFIFISFTKNEGIELSHIALLIASALGAGLLVYGAICVIANIRIGKTERGIREEMQKNVDNAFKSQKQNGAN